MANNIRLQRQAINQPWGFRIHGGADFSQPLVIVKVTAGSLASQNGLAPGDTLIQINGKDALRMKHKEAQDIIMGAGNQVELQVHRAGSSTWKPQVQVLGEANRSPAGAPAPQVTKTSLAKTPGGPPKPLNPQVNSQAKPFSVVSQQSPLSCMMETVEQGGQVMVNNQYNTPINIYSEQSIAETLSAQSEVLAGGAIGVNFKKNERKYDYENSEVYKMLQIAESEDQGRTPPPMSPKSQVPLTPVTLPQVQLRSVAPKPAAAPPPSVAQGPAPTTQLGPVAPAPIQAPSAPTAAPVAPGGGSAAGNPSVCAECERLIVGVFVRIKDKNLHVDCFKCNTCGQSLKNIGYYNINNKLYCDVHAKTVARANTGIEPLPTTMPAATAAAPAMPTPPLGSSTAPPPFAPKPFGGFQGIRPQSPQVDSYAQKMAPLPFHQSPTGGISHVTAPKSPTKAPSYLQQQQQSQQMQQQNVQQTQGGGLLQQYSSFESSHQQSSYSTSSSVSQNQLQQSGSGLRVTWPPGAGEGGDQSAGAPAASQSLLQQAPPAPAAAPFSAAPQQFSTFGQSQGQQQQFKPVAPPKFQQKQVPYKPLTTLLTPAAGSRPAAPTPAAPPAPSLIQQTIPPPSAPAAPISIPPPVIAPPAPAPAPGPSMGAGAGGGAGGKGGKTSLSILPKRGKGVLTQPGPRVAICSSCQKQIRGPFITANSKFYCPDHFKCATPNCSRPLMDVGFVEEKGALHCEYCWESHLAPQCGRCRNRIKYECLNAIGQSFHPECFACKACNKPFGNTPFFLEDGEPYCDADWNELFTTKCYACGFPIEAGDRWVEAMNQNYHSQCFNCAACKKNLEGQSFFAKAGRPFCKSHAR